MKKVNQKLLEVILNEIKKNNKITEKELAIKYYYSERTIRRYFKLLKNHGKIKFIKIGKNRSWNIV